MKFTIIEDEIPAYENLAHKLRTLHPDAWIYPQLVSVKDALTFFNQSLPSDLIFADIHLQDGKSFDVLRSYPATAPIVFTTAHGHYMQDAFEMNGIDYLLKPVDITKLKKTLEKYDSLKTFFQPATSPASPLAARERIIVRRGNDFQLLPVEDIVYLFSENKLVFAVDREKRKFLCNDNSLSDLILQLDPALFFRASRKYIIHIRHIEKFHPDERSRIVVRMTVPPDEAVIVSQENAGAFRKWVEG